MRESVRQRKLEKGACNPIKATVEVGLARIREQHEQREELSLSFHWKERDALLFASRLNRARIQGGREEKREVEREVERERSRGREVERSRG